jgi:hypothetical protein
VCTLVCVCVNLHRLLLAPFLYCHCVFVCMRVLVCVHGLAPMNWASPSRLRLAGRGGGGLMGVVRPCCYMASLPAAVGVQRMTGLVDGRMKMK